MDFIFDLQLFGGGKGGGGSTTVTNREPTAAENALTEQALAYSQAVSPNALTLNDKAAGLLFNSIGDTQQNFNNMNQNAQRQIVNATQGISNLVGSNNAATTSANNNLGGYSTQYGTANTATNSLLGSLSPQYQRAASQANQQLATLANGQLPSQYQQNMENSIRTALKNTMGNNLNALAQRGVVNSSVTNSAMNNIAKNAADTVAQQYQNNINQIGNLVNQQLGNTNTALGAQGSLAQQQLGNTNTTLGAQTGLTQQALQNALGTNSANGAVYQNLLSSATAPITTAAAAQEAAQQPALNLWNASLGLNGATNGALAAVSGNGTTTSTTTNNGGGGLFSGLLGGLF